MKLLRMGMACLLVAIIALVGAFVLPTKAQAAALASGTCGESLEWTLDDAGVLTISGTGAMSNDGQGNSPWYEYVDNIQAVVISKDVTSVSEYAFYDCDNLTDTYYQGTQAQWNAITIEGGNRSLTDAVMHFYIATGDCGENASWVLDEDGVLTISGTGDMYDYTIGNLPDFDRYTVINRIIVEDGITSIGDYAFYGHRDSQDAQDPDNKDDIGFDEFYGYSCVTYVSIGQDVADIGSYAFASCDDLTDVYFIGSELKWGRVTISEGNENLTNASIEFGKILNGWVFLDGQWHYFIEDVAQTGWLLDGDTWYYLDSTGVMVTGWLEENEAWYYMDFTGAMVTEKTIIDGAMYEFASTGVCQGYASGWQQLDGKLYYAGTDGKLFIGWLQDNSVWYYMDSTGAAVTGNAIINGALSGFDTAGIWQGYLSGWQQLDGKWYYAETGGKLTTLWKSINGTYYYFDASGVMQTGWLKSGNVWYYLQSSGAMATGWCKVGAVWYYFDNSGAMLTGWQKIGSAWYYFNNSGVMQTGWQQIGGTWYYFQSGGAMQTGWQQIGGTWYYFNTSGAMATGWQQISGKWYYFNNSGVMQTGWQQIGGTWYYFQSGGAMQTGWLKLGSTWYYFQSSGAMATGSVKIGTKTYNFNASGACLNP